MLPFGCKDNFWEMGDTGPCGPCTEIHYDRLGGRDASSLVNADDPTCIEIWNNVFMQFNREADRSLRPLPAKHVDTGMGFERLVSILQNKPSNYDTDVFAPLFAAIQASTGARPYGGKLGAEDVDNVDTAYRVVADHIRTLSFAIADGAQPGPDGRNYVLRRILRRAVRYGRDCLHAPEGFFSRLVPTLQASMGGQFPELVTRGAAIQAILAEEEASFGRTLVKGLAEFNKMATAAKAGGSSLLPGADAFLLWDTFGFPVDLTQLMAEERGMRVDAAGFSAAMEEAKARSRMAHKKQGEKAISFEAEATAELARRGVTATADGPKYTWHVDVAATVRALLTPDGFVDAVDDSTPGPVGVVLDATPFYAESGGQAADTGVIRTASGGAGLHVGNTIVAAGYVLHVGSPAAPLAVGEAVTACVDYTRRSLVAPNHTLTHVLNLALRDVLGGHIEQRGSLVDADKLRFDFSHPKPVEDGQLAAIEAAVRASVAASLGVYAKEVPLAQAKGIAGLRAVFGEAYPDPVRVVSVGAPVEALLADPGNGEAWKGVSVEFCGGTHLSNTAQAQAFALLSEEGIAKGVRRIVGVTRQAAEEAIQRARDLGAELVGIAASGEDSTLDARLAPFKAQLAVAIIPAPAKAELTAQVGELTKRVLAAGKAQAGAFRDKAVAACTSAAQGKKVATLRCDVDTDADALRAGAQAAAQQHGCAVAIVSADADKDKLMVYISVPPEVEALGLDCKAWLAAALAPVGGKGGGGKGGLAQGQATGAAKADDALAAAQQFAAEALKGKL